MRVLCQGREIAAATPTRTVDALIASLVARGDPRLMFPAELVVQPPDTTAALEGQAAQYFLESAPAAQKDPVAALRFAERTVAIRPDSPAAHQVLALAQQATVKTNEAAASIRKAIAILHVKGSDENRRKLEETLKLIENTHESDFNRQ